jgi:ribosomal protein S18 acetylase RimI-like enzyme
MAIEIRRLKATDAALLDKVADEVFDAPVVPARLAAYLAEPVNLMVVALLDGLVVGQTAAVIHRHPDKPDELFIDEVGVSPAFQRRGIARRMMLAMFDWGRERGCASSWLGTEIDNTAARALYVSLGEDGEEIVMFDYDL